MIDPVPLLLLWKRMPCQREIGRRWKEILYSILFSVKKSIAQLQTEKISTKGSCSVLCVKVRGGNAKLFFGIYSGIIILSLFFNLFSNVSRQKKIYWIARIFSLPSHGNEWYAWSFSSHRFFQSLPNNKHRRAVTAFAAGVWWYDKAVKIRRLRYQNGVF